MNSLDPNGSSAIAIGVFIGLSTIIGAAVGAFTAACTGEDVLEATIEGALTGAVAGVATVFVPQLIAAVLPATASAATLATVSTVATFGAAATGGFLVDISVQIVSHTIRANANEQMKIDWGRAGKTALTTGIAGVVPTIVNPAQSVINAVGATFVGLDASVINATLDILITKFVL